MSHPIHHRTWFPFVLVGLTFSLILLVAWVYANKQDVVQDTNKTEPDVVEMITDEEYVASLSRIVSGFLMRFDETGSDQERLALLEQTQSDVLDLLVPAARKDLHLELAVSLSLLRKGVQGDAAALADGRRRLEAVLEEEPWLR